MTTSFLRDISSNPANAAILARWREIDLPNAWLVAGCLFQTIWNLQSGRHPDAGIKDYDIFYFDDADMSEAGERDAQAQATAVLADLGITIEVANQARVHLWYPRFFSRPYPQLASTEEGISRFLVLETCVGVRPNQATAPFGVAGIYAGALSPNPLTPYPELFAQKVASYRSRWPDLCEKPPRV
ncbi:MAG: nucleotidyltransferase family protein [Alphaproteobacteria bacterium]|nr:nucleotidyltransferase family protein [Alphaproteobacteria bacterium]